MMNATGFLGIDVSKGYADFTLLNCKKQVIEKGFQLDDTKSGHKELEALLKSFCDDYALEEIFCGLESTGGYENNWYNALLAINQHLPIKVGRLNPKGVKANHEASLSRNVTDELSSRYIAEFMISHPEKVRFNAQPFHNFDSLRSQYKYIKMLSKQSTQLSNQLEKHIYKVLPELLRYARNGFPTWLLQLVEKYPTATKLSRATVKVVARIKNITPQKATSIISKAKNSVSNVDDPFMASIITSTAKQILQIRNVIGQQKDLLVNNAKGKQVELLKSIKGVASYSAVALLIEIENIKRFESAKKLSSFAGIHPRLKQSGDMKKISRMSKTGRPGIREVMFNVARTAVVHDPHIRSKYLGLRKKGMSYLAAIGVIMHKLLRIAYGVLKNQQPYDGNIDQQNQERNLTTGKTLQDRMLRNLKYARRYQDQQQDAPISGRNYKKRKALDSSQSNVITEHGIKKPVPNTKV